MHNVPPALALALSVTGCGVSLAPPVVHSAVPAPAPVAPAVAPVLVSAHVSRFNVLELGGLDAVLVVVSDQLDPLGVRASAFSFALHDGRQVSPVRASVWPAHERGELRSILIEADIGDPGSPAPVNVTVIGHVFTADGRDLRGASAAVRPFDEPDRLQAWVVLDPGETDCPNGGAAVRTFWSDLVRLDPNGTESARFVRDDGSAVVATDVVDQEQGGGTDNVLDFCTPNLEGVRRLLIPPILQDAAGHSVAGAVVDLR